jgi:hypothetical protein
MLKYLLLISFIFNTSCTDAKDQNLNKKKSEVKTVEHHIYPQELIEDAQKHNCEPIKHSKKKSGKPYIYGVVKEAPTKLSAAYWCSVKGEHKDIIVIYLNKKYKSDPKFNFSLKSCKNEIDNVLNIPLELTNHTQESLNITGIMNGYMEGDLIYCENGKWKTTLIH